MLAVLLAIAAPLGPGSSRYLDSGSVMLAGGLLLALTAGSLPGGRLPIATLLFIAFAAWSAVIVPHSLAPFDSQQAVAVWMAAVAVCIAASQADPRHLRGILHSLALGGVALSVQGFWQLAHATRSDRMLATFGNPDCLGAVLMLALVLTVALGIERPLWERALTAIEACIIGAGVIFTGSRSAWLGCAIGLILLIAMIVRRTRSLHVLARSLAAPGLLLLCGAAWLTLQGSSPLARVGDLLWAQAPLEVHEAVLAAAPRMLAVTPVRGCGPACFALAFEPFRPHLDGFNGWVNQAHVEPLQVAIEYGLPGFVLLSLSIGLPLAAACREPRLRDLPHLAAACALIALLAYSLTNFWLPVAADVVWFGLLLGVAAAHPRTPGITLRPVLGTALGLLLVLAGLWAARFGWVTLQVRGANLDTLPACDRAVSLQPDNEHLYMQRARIEQKLGRLEDATRDVETALRLCPRTHDLTAFAAWILVQAGHVRRARSILQRGTQTYPEDWTAWLELGRLEMSDEHFHRALKCFGQVLPESDEVTPDLARAVATLEVDSQGGLAWLQACYRGQPALHHRLRELAFQAAQFLAPYDQDVAARFDMAALAWNPHDLTALEALAHLRSGPQSQALLEQVVAAVETPGRHPPADVGLGVDALRQIMQLVPPAQAIQEARAWLTVRPEDDDIRMALASIYLGRHQTEQAIEVYLEGVREHPDDAFLIGVLADCYRDSGMLESARQAYTTAARLNPREPRYLRELQRLR
ncbi:MAG: tetratricopeptide repeat protein [Candidatus Xenobia bacterium]